MPLLINNKFGYKVATKDIKCYKLFKKGINCLRSIYSRNQEKYLIGNTYDTGNEVHTSLTLISDGYFHFWKNKEDAIEVLSINSYLGNMNKDEIALIECSIPKGIEYYEGLAGCYQSLASPVMRLEKEIIIPKLFDVNFREPNKEDIIKYWNDVVKKTLPKDKRIFDDKKKLHTKILWQIEDYHNRRK